MVMITIAMVVIIVLSGMVGMILEAVFDDNESGHHTNANADDAGIFKHTHVKEAFERIVGNDPDIVRFASLLSLTHPCLSLCSVQCLSPPCLTQCTVQCTLCFQKQVLTTQTW